LLGGQKKILASQAAEHMNKLRCDQGCRGRARR